MKYFIGFYRGDAIKQYNPEYTQITVEDLQYDGVPVETVDEFRRFLFETMNEYPEHWLDENLTFASELTQEEFEAR